MSKWIYVIFGVFIFSLGILGIMSGKTYAVLGTGTYAPRIITYENDFVEFCISIGVTLFIGAMLVIKSLFAKKGTNN